MLFYAAMTAAILCRIVTIHDKMRTLVTEHASKIHKISPQSAAHSVDNTRFYPHFHACLWIILWILLILTLS